MKDFVVSHSSTLWSTRSIKLKYTAHGTLPQLHTHVLISDDFHSTNEVNNQLGNASITWSGAVEHNKLSNSMPQKAKTYGLD